MPPRKIDKDDDTKDEDNEDGGEVKKDEGSDEDNEGSSMKKKEDAEAVEVRDVSYQLEILVDKLVSIISQSV